MQLFSVLYYDILGKCGGNCEEDLDDDGVYDKRLGNDDTTLCTHSDSTGTCLGICWVDYDGIPVTKVTSIATTSVTCV